MVLRKFTILLLLGLCSSSDLVELASRAYYHHVPKLEQEKTEIQALLDSPALEPHLSAIQDNEDMLEHIELSTNYSNMLFEEAEQNVVKSLEMTFALMAQSKSIFQEFNDLKDILLKTPAKVKEIVALINTKIEFDFDADTASKNVLKEYQELSNKIDENLGIQVELEKQIKVFRELQSKIKESRYNIKFYSSILNYLAEIGSPEDEMEHFRKEEEKAIKDEIDVYLVMVRLNSNIRQIKNSINDNLTGLLIFNLSSFKFFLSVFYPVFQFVLKENFVPFDKDIQNDFNKEDKDIYELIELNQDVTLFAQVILSFEVDAIKTDDTHLVEFYSETIKKIRKALFNNERKNVCKTFKIHELKHQMLFSMQYLTGEPHTKMKHVRYVFDALTRASLFMCITWDFGMRILLESDLASLSFNFQNKMKELIELKEAKLEDKWEEILENDTESLQKYWKLKQKAEKRGDSITLLVKLRKYTLGWTNLAVLLICTCSVLASIVFNSMKFNKEKQPARETEYSF